MQKENGVKKIKNLNLGENAEKIIIDVMYLFIFSK